MSRVRASLAGPSLLLQHLNHSLDSLRNLYRVPSIPAASADATSSVDVTTQASSSRFPLPPSSAADGDALVRFFCEELDMGYEAVRRWRRELRQRQTINADWGRLALPVHSSQASSIKKCKDARGALQSFVPRAQDVRLVRSAVADLHATISPLLTLSPPPSPQAAQCSDNSNDLYSPPDTRPTCAHDTSTFYATRPIPAGMFVLSIPTESVFFAQPPASSDALLTYFLYVDDLIGQLVACVMDEATGNTNAKDTQPTPSEQKAAAPPASHATYVRYLMESIVPCRNLPFLSREELLALLHTGTQASSTDSSTTMKSVNKEENGRSDETAVQSPALDLWSFFHETMQRGPLSPYLRDRLSQAEYAWWVSAVLSRRAGAATLVPLLDKLNHSARPNCYYTMSTTEALCGLDVLDNIVAGVEAEGLYEPHVHVFAIRDIAAGEPLTVCYASANASHYHYIQNNNNKNKNNKNKDNKTNDKTEEEEDASSLLSALASTPLTISASSSSSSRKAAEVTTGEGRAMWQLQWGFVPQEDAVYSASDLREVASLVAERRVDTRSLLFPV